MSQGPAAHLPGENRSTGTERDPRGRLRHHRNDQHGTHTIETESFISAIRVRLDPFPVRRRSISDHDRTRIHLVDVVWLSAIFVPFGSHMDTSARSPMWARAITP